MKVYVETNPETIYSGRVKDEVKTTEIRMWFETDEEIEVQSLSDYTKQVRKEVLEQVYKVFTNEDVWKELKDWWLVNGNCKELKRCLDAMIEEKSVENIAKKFGHYKNFYQQLDLIQGEDK